MEKDKLGYYYERTDVIERYFRDGQFVDAECEAYGGSVKKTPKAEGVELPTICSQLKLPLLISVIKFYLSTELYGNSEQVGGARKGATFFCIYSGR